jgi:hypothetical protein
MAWLLRVDGLKLTKNIQSFDRRQPQVSWPNSYQARLRHCAEDRSDGIWPPRSTDDGITAEVQFAANQGMALARPPPCELLMTQEPQHSAEVTPVFI